MSGEHDEHQTGQERQEPLPTEPVRDEKHQPSTDEVCEQRRQVIAPRCETDGVIVQVVHQHDEGAHEPSDQRRKNDGDAVSRRNNAQEIEIIRHEKRVEHRSVQDGDDGGIYDGNWRVGQVAPRRAGGAFQGADRQCRPYLICCTLQDRMVLIDSVRRPAARRGARLDQFHPLACQSRLT